MPNEPRSSGIASVGDVPWGAHFCHFYETPEDLLDILVPYFKAGLENNEFCMWIVCNPLTEVDGRQALRNTVPEFDRRMAAGNIEIIPHSQWCLTQGIFDAQRVIAGWKEKLGRAQAGGYAGMRVNGNTAWVTGEDWTDFARCEYEFSRTIATERMLLLCAYPLPARSASDLFDVTRSHEFAIARRHGSWQVVDPRLRDAKAELGAYAAELENRVVERTRELGQANERLRALSGRLQGAREEEGARIAREIHDRIGSALTSLKWDLEGVDRVLAETQNLPQLAELRRRMVAMIGLTDQTLDTVRRIASELRPSILDDLGLVEAVEWQAKEFHTRTGIPCHYRCSLEDVDLSPGQSTNLFRILQEALTNILRHAHATSVDIVLEKQSGNLVLTIRDNGVGITSAQTSSPDALGLLGMRERARAAGGTINISGEGGKGTTVVVQVLLLLNMSKAE
jgi:signal transduction histidine kinase